MARSGPISLNRVKPRKTGWKTHDISIWNSPDPAWGARALRRRVVTLSDVTGGAVASPPSVRRQLDNVGYSIPRSKTRGLRDPGAKTAKIWPGHLLKLESVPNAKSPKNLPGGVFQKFSKRLQVRIPPVVKMRNRPAVSHKVWGSNL